MTVYNDLFWDKPFHQVSQPVVTPPGDASEEYRYLAALAQRLGTEITLPGGRLDVNSPPDALDALTLLFPEGATKLSVGEIATHEVGKIYEEYRAVEVIPAMEGMDQKLQFVPEGVEEEFAMLAAWSEADSLPEGYSHLMICRRNPHVYNSMCHEFPSAPADNPAWLHPEDIEEAGLEAGQQIWIESAAGKVTARLDADKTLRRGVLALSHGFGGKSGTSAARLLSTATTTDRYTRIPQMTAVPVKLSASV
jgi:anaerobic selenocysteine-containing dehydrogenase